MPLFSRSSPRLNLALQGGGAHGAFTWGVLDSLLEADAFSIATVAGTSAGAVNGALLVSGLVEEGPLAAREKLSGFWTALAAMSATELNDYQKMLMPSLVGLTKLMAPKDLNPLKFDPLADLLKAWVNFDVLSHRSAQHLVVAATDVKTALPKLFRSPGITLDMVRASACLPTIQEAVEIDGRQYWDGGFTANPPLQCLLTEPEAASDTLIVQLNPTVLPENPSSRAEIEDAVNRVTFQQPMLRDIQFILDLRNAVPTWGFGAATYAKAASAHRFHVIDATPVTSVLDAKTKIEPTPELVAELHSAGQHAAELWLDKHQKNVGKRETVDLTSHYFSGDA